MARRNRDSKAIDNTIEGNRFRSSAFRWMVKNHDEFTQRWAGHKIDWRTVCSQLAELGKTDTKGNPVTEGNARETWRQVRKYVVKIRATQAAQAPRPINPSRLPQEWKPANAPPPSTTAPEPTVSALLPGGPSDQFASIRKKLPHEKKPYDPDAALARLDRVINERSGR